MKRIFLQILGNPLIPSMSSVTSICPSQCEEEPIPIVGIFKFFVINFDAFGVIHSSIIEKAPAFSISSFLIKFLISFLLIPSILNFF